MSDRLRDIALGLVGLALLNGVVRDRAREALRIDTQRHITGGQLRVRVESSGWFGMLLGKASVAHVSGTGCRLDDVPFRAAAGGGMRAEVRAVRLDLRDVTFRGLHLQSMSAEIPFVSIDAGRALFDNRVVVRRAGTGTATIRIGPDAIAEFARRKFPTLNDVTVDLADGRATVGGTLPILGLKRRVSVSGSLVCRDGVHVELVDARVEMDRKAVEPGLRGALLAALGPIMDVDRDLGLSAFLRVDRVDVTADAVVIRGRATIGVGAPSAPVEVPAAP